MTQTFKLSNLDGRVTANQHIFKSAIEWKTSAWFEILFKSRLIYSGFNAKFNKWDFLTISEIRKS